MVHNISITLKVFRCLFFTYLSPGGGGVGGGGGGMGGGTLFSYLRRLGPFLGGSKF